MTLKVKIVHAVYTTCRKPIHQVISESRAIVQGMTGNSHFPDPYPPLATISQAIDALDTAAVQAQFRTVGSVAHMHSLVLPLGLLLSSLLKYVERIANENLTDAVSIITSIPFAIRKTPVQGVKGYRIHPTAVAGELFIMTIRVKNATYNFELSTDPLNPASWQSIYKGNKCKFVKTGLVSGTRYFVRVKVTDGNGENRAGQVLSSVVL